MYEIFPWQIYCALPTAAAAAERAATAVATTTTATTIFCSGILSPVCGFAARHLATCHAAAALLSCLFSGWLVVLFCIAPAPARCLPQLLLLPRPPFAHLHAIHFLKCNFHCFARSWFPSRTAHFRLPATLPHSLNASLNPQRNATHSNAGRAPAALVVLVPIVANYTVMLGVALTPRSLHTHAHTHTLRLRLRPVWNIHCNPPQICA